MIDSGRRTGGGWCGAACEPRVLSLEVVAWKKISVLSQPERCTERSEYAVVCPFHTIRMHKLVDAGTPQSSDMTSALATESLDRLPERWSCPSFMKYELQESLEPPRHRMQTSPSSRTVHSPASLRVLERLFA